MSKAADARSNPPHPNTQRRIAKPTNVSTGEPTPMSGSQISPTEPVQADTGE
jgi:hypothetical protein